MSTNFDFLHYLWHWPSLINTDIGIYILYNHTRYITIIYNPQSRVFMNFIHKHTITIMIMIERLSRQ